MQSAERAGEHRATPPQLPELTPAAKQNLEADASYRSERERVERRSVIRGLILIILLVLVASILRAGFGRVFAHGWWRP